MKSIDQRHERFTARSAVGDGADLATVEDPTVEDLVIRAQRLREWATDWPGPLAAASRRRAAELEFVATVLEPLTDETGPRPGARVRLRGQRAG